MTYNIDMGEGIFTDWLFMRFAAWEKQQPKRRSSYAAFATWLSNNQFDIEVSQQNLSNWISGKNDPSEKYIWVLADRLGEEVFDFFPNALKPDPILTYVINRWTDLPENVQREIHEMVEEYLGAKDDITVENKTQTKPLPNHQ